MKWTIHHVTLQTSNVPASEAFFRDVLGLEAGPTGSSIGSGTSAVSIDKTKFSTVGNGNRGLHLSRLLPDYAEKAGLGINPSLGGHVAIAVEDFDAVRKRLDEAGVYYAYAGDHAMKGVRQIYLYDPSGNVVELNSDFTRI
jgi:catechol 2,3-dioxygenase-like lactoylglutathione lyase family enzyme